MCPTYREVRLIKSNLSDLSDKFNMVLDTNPTKQIKCVRLIEKSNLSKYDLPRVDYIYIYIYIYI